MQKFPIIFDKEKVHQRKRSSKKAFFTDLVPISTPQASFLKLRQLQPKMEDWYTK
jgi:hypothetical protein